MRIILFHISVFAFLIFISNIWCSIISLRISECGFNSLYLSQDLACLYNPRIHSFIESGEFSNIISLYSFSQFTSISPSEYSTDIISFCLFLYCSFIYLLFSSPSLCISKSFLMSIFSLALSSLPLNLLIFFK